MRLKETMPIIGAGSALGREMMLGFMAGQVSNPRGDSVI